MLANVRWECRLRRVYEATKRVFVVEGQIQASGKRRMKYSSVA